MSDTRCDISLTVNGEAVSETIEARTSLVEQHGPEFGRIEQLGVIGLAAAARPAVQEHCRHSGRSAVLFDVERVATADGER